jgi:hypothetical protein
MISVTVHSRARAGVAGCRAPRLPGAAPAVAHPPRQLHRRSALERPPEPEYTCDINQCCVTVHPYARAGVAGCRAPRLPGAAPAVAHPSRQLHRCSALERPRVILLTCVAWIRIRIDPH